MISLAAGDVSRAWAVWSGAVESALVDSYQFSGGPLFLVGAWFWVEVVLLLGLFSLVVIRYGRLRGYAADAHDAADVFLYRDSSVASPP